MEQGVDMIMSAAQAADQLLEELHKQVGISVEAQAKIREHMVRDAQTAAKAIAAKYRTHRAADTDTDTRKTRKKSRWSRRPMVPVVDRLGADENLECEFSIATDFDGLRFWVWGFRPSDFQSNSQSLRWAIGV
eukprot:COSAG02_NODE_335_length_24359_cov_282.817354_15_plen_133_part_00